MTDAAPDRHPDDLLSLRDADDPVFVTPESLGDWWQDGKLHRKLMVDLNGQPFGRAEAGEDMTFDFGTLIAHAAKTRKLGAGTIVGSGTVSQRMSPLPCQVNARMIVCPEFAERVQSGPALRRAGDRLPGRPSRM